MPNLRQHAEHRHHGRPWRKRATLGLVVLALSCLAGCGFQTDGSEESAEPETEGITLYSGRIAAALGGANDAYEAASETDVQVRYAASADLGATLVEEGSSSPADAFFAQESPAMGAVAEQGLLAKLPEDILDSVPAAYRDPARRWVGVTGRARALAYNEQAVSQKELPDSPLELAEPEWRGRVGWGPATGSLQEYVTQLRLAEGDDVAREWLEGMVANDVTSYPDNVTIRDGVASGEIDVGLINHYYVAQAIAGEGEDYPVGVHFPPEDLGSTVLVTSIGVLESSDRKQEAFDYVRFMLNDDSQGFFTETSKEYPLVPGVERDPTLERPLSAIPAPDTRSIDLAELQETIELMQETGAL